ncbi:MAG: cation:proton antiporter [Verrucomicrobiae bacterium]|nr:cation:proton antiporter [Verrucomicrobiae bacterium]NNJ42849.1 cation:proton antiporter [Akkermansiaceae bacterium]
MSSISPEVIPAPVILLSAGMLGLSVVFALIRIIRGPTTPDRVIGVDLLAGLVMAGLLIAGISSGNPYYLQAVLGFAVILFLGTIAIARYLSPANDNDS